MNQGPFDNDNQFVVSYELLQLLRWLLRFEQESLKKLIIKAINSDFQSKNNEKNSAILDSDLEQEIQLAIIDFFTMLEILLYESMDENKIKSVLHKKLIPAINNVDSNVYNNYDIDTLNASIAKVKNNLNDKNNVKEVFCKELLKRWKPSKNTIIN